MSANAIALLSLGAAVAAVIAAFVIYRLQQDRKGLDWSVISAAELLKDNPIRDLELHYMGEVVRNPYLLQLKYINTGNKPISTEDYEHPVRVSITDSRVLSAEVVETSQPDMGASMSLSEHEATLHPLLLNPGDWVSCQILLDSPPSRWQVKGRIVGVKEIRSYKAGRRTLSPLTKTILVMLGFGIVAGLLIAASSESLVAQFPALKWVPRIVATAAIIFAICAITFSIYDAFSRSERSRI
jgi:hypothetical protein